MTVLSIVRLPIGDMIQMCRGLANGSKFSEAELKTEDGDQISHGWSVLDIAKHAIRTFIGCLDVDDYVTIVTYASRAQVSSARPIPATSTCPACEAGDV